MEIEKTEIPGILILNPKVFEDDRGFFLESYNKKDFEEAGIAEEFVQDNHSRSCKGVLRGLHYQQNHPQGKLIRAVRGKVLDVIVDIRKGSPTFGQWLSVELSAENKKQIWIPKGLAHGFSVLSNEAEFCYKVTDFYHPEDEKGILWNDPQLAIDWQVSDPILSAKDQLLPTIDEANKDLPVFEPDST